LENVNLTTTGDTEQRQMSLKQARRLSFSATIGQKSATSYRAALPTASCIPSLKHFSSMLLKLQIF